MCLIYENFNFRMRDQPQEVFMTISKTLSDPCSKHINTANCQGSLRQLGSHEYQAIYKISCNMWREMILKCTDLS